MNKLKDHSQNGEASIVLNYFGEYRGYQLLDIGANDGITFSNSYDLIQAGWNGMLLEPSPKAFAKLQALHKGNNNISVFKCGVLADPGKPTRMKFYESGAHLPDNSDVAAKILEI